MDNIEKLTERDFKDNYISKDISSSIKAVWILLFFSSLATFFSLALKNPWAYLDVIATFILGCLVLLFKSRIAAIITVIYYVYSFIDRLYNNYSNLSSSSLTSRYMMALIFFSLYIKGAKATFDYHKLRKQYFSGKINQNVQNNNLPINKVPKTKNKSKNISRIASYNSSEDNKTNDSSF